MAFGTTCDRDMTYYQTHNSNVFADIWKGYIFVLHELRSTIGFDFLIGILIYYVRGALIIYFYQATDSGAWKAFPAQQNIKFKSNLNSDLQKII